MAVDAAVRTYSKMLNVPANTLATAPAHVTWSSEDNYCRWIEIYIPRGANGQVGTRLLKSSGQIMPRLDPSQTINWIIADTFYARYEFEDYLPTTDLVVQGYNTGKYAHTLYWRLAMSTYSAGNSVQQPLAGLPGATAASADPLSPDAQLGASTASAVQSGQISPSDAATTPAPVYIYPKPTDLDYTPKKINNAIFKWKEPYHKDHPAPHGYFWELLNRQGKDVSRGFTTKLTAEASHLIGGQEYEFHVRAGRTDTNGVYASLRFHAHDYGTPHTPIPNSELT